MDTALRTPTVTDPAPPAQPAPARSVVEARRLTRVWGDGPAAQTAVNAVDLTVRTGEVLAIVGPSGSGKSTLGAMLAGIDRPTSGSIVACGQRTDAMKDKALARWRGRHVGIVFQDFHLLPTLTATENVELGLKLTGVRRNRGGTARAALAQVGLAEKSDRVPSQLSGGEQQRVAIARAVAVQPELLVADEPTGSLDQATGHAVFTQLLALRQQDTAIVVITHDAVLAEHADRVIHMVDGQIVDERFGTEAVAA
jgi:putative ABC transport system ATP-binding protein